MSLFSIDQDKCGRDGLCVAECPLHIIELKDESQVPTPVNGAEEMCINCGHCMAVCSHGAFSLDKVALDECTVIDKELEAGTQASLQFLKSRRSIRSYQSKPVDRETLERIVDTARWAPTALNLQPVQWLILETPGEVKKLSGLVIEWIKGAEAFPENYKKVYLEAWEKGRELVFRGAPHLAIAHAAPESLMPATDCPIALTYLELAAHACGVGACWAGILMMAVADPAVARALNLPEGHKLQGAMMLGYSQYKYHLIPQRNKTIAQWR